MKERELRALEESLSDEERELLDDLAVKISKRKMITPALFFLESVKPLGFISSQLMYFFRPMVQSLWTNPTTYDKVSKILERRGSLELLLRRIEAHA